MGRASPGDVTGLLLQWNQGKPEARERLIPLVYQQLRRLAGRSLKSERANCTLQPTVLVHEVYLKLIDSRRVSWRDRTHFYAVAAGLMRRIVVDHARRRSAAKRGGHARAVTISEEAVGTATAAEVDVMALDEALIELAGFDPDQARIVELRFFGGLSLEETAEAVGTSRATVHREWAVARTWLHRRLTAQ